MAKYNPYKMEALNAEESIVGKLNIRLNRLKNLKDIKAPEIIVNNEKDMICLLVEDLVKNVHG